MLRRWGVAWGIFLGLGVCVSWLGFVVQASPSLGNAAIMLVSMLVVAPIAWFVYMWITAEVVNYRRRASDRRSGRP